MGTRTNRLPIWRSSPTFSGCEMKLKHHPLWLQRVVGAVLCGLYCLLGTPAPALATAILAAIDGGHTISFSHQGESVQVVLGHEVGSGLRTPNHHHCVVARTLVLFSEPTSPREPDHVLQFGQRGTALSGTGDKVGLLGNRTELAPNRPLLFFVYRPPTCARPLPRIWEPPPPHGLQARATTVLQV